MVDICLNDKQCSNGGVCSGNKCICPSGTYGARCDAQNVDSDTDISLCTEDGNQCQNGGVCIKDTTEINNVTVDANFCKCPDGYFGGRCHGHSGGGGSAAVPDGTTWISVCTKDGGECKNGGTCVLETETHNGQVVDANYCRCPDGGLGSSCDFDHSSGPDGTGDEDEDKPEPEDNTEDEVKPVVPSRSVCTKDGGQCKGGTCVLATEKVNGQTVDANYCICPDGGLGSHCDPAKSSGQGGANDEVKSDEVKSDEVKSDEVKSEPADDTKETAPDNNACTPEKNICQNGAPCIKKTEIIDGKQRGANYCKCPEGYSGKLCHGTPPMDNNQDNKDSEAKNQDSKNDNPDGTAGLSVCTKDGKECQNGAPCVIKTMELGGETVDANYCKCPDGFFGAVCHGKHSNPQDSNDATLPVSKNDNGTSKTPIDKSSGPDKICSKDGDECKNGGICVLSDFGNYCSCPEGFSGTVCDSEYICPLDCKHGSSCRHFDQVNGMINSDGLEPTSFYCECVGNYKGMTCNIPYQSCPKSKDGKNLDCLYGGECIEGFPGDYVCKCPKDRTGGSCEFGQQSNIEDYNGPCFANDDCFNGGLCIREHDADETAKSGMLSKRTHCLCTSGWGGDNCEAKCDLDCQHGGSCRFASGGDDDAATSGPYCDCRDIDFTGDYCEIPLDECPGNDGIACMHGGKCTGADSGVFCDCPPGRTGLFCESIDGNAKPSQPSISNSNSNNSFGFSPSSSSSSSSSVPVGLTSIITVVAVLSLVGLLTFTFYRRKVSLKSGVLDEDAAQVENGENGTAEGSSGGVASQADGDEDIFDYDTSGVVDVNLDDTEPVELDKEKQIV